MRNDVANAPILDAYNIGHGTCVVWCDHCCLWHHHGAHKTPIHVAAHCAWIYPPPPEYSGDSPYLKTGYWLKPAGPATPEIICDITRAPPRGPVRH